MERHLAINKNKALIHAIARMSLDNTGPFRFPGARALPPPAAAHIPLEPASPASAPLRRPWRTQFQSPGRPSGCRLYGETSLPAGSRCVPRLWREVGVGSEGGSVLPSVGRKGPPPTFVPRTWLRADRGGGDDDSRRGAGLGSAPPRPRTGRQRGLGPNAGSEAGAGRAVVGAAAGR